PSPLMPRCAASAPGSAGSGCGTGTGICWTPTGPKTRSWWSPTAGCAEAEPGGRAVAPRAWRPGRRAFPEPGREVFGDTSRAWRPDERGTVMTAGQWPLPERPDRPEHDSGPGPTATGAAGLWSAAAGPSGPGPRTQRPPQPLQLARALLILFLVRIGLLIMSEFGVEAAVWGRRAMDVRDPLLH